MSQIFWRQHAQARRGGPCLFLDRDGVLVREVGYLHEVDKVEVLAGAPELVRQARSRGFIVGVITNQAGVGRGFYDWSAFEAVQAELERRLGQAGQPLAFDFVAACGAHPQASHDHMRIEAHPWRKPAPGMLTMAAQALEIDMAASVLIGDQASDIAAGLAAGVGRCVHVFTGHGHDNREAVRARASQVEPGRVLLAEDLEDAAAQLRWT